MLSERNTWTGECVSRCQNVRGVVAGEPVRTVNIASIVPTHSHNIHYTYALCKAAAIVSIAAACDSAANSVHLASPSACKNVKIAVVKAYIRWLGK